MYAEIILVYEIARKSVCHHIFYSLVGRSQRDLKVNSSQVPLVFFGEYIHDCGNGTQNKNNVFGTLNFKRISSLCSQMYLVLHSGFDLLLVEVDFLRQKI